MNFPKKWRETINPFELKFTNFILKEILGYPHAGNDVFYAKGIYNNEETYAFIKVNRQKGADVKNEIEVLNKIQLDNTPIIIDYDKEMTFRVSIALTGERLTTILADNANLESLEYLEKYGKKLGEIHLITGDFNNVKDRKFFHIPPKKYFEENGLDLSIYEYLNSNKPEVINYCFCHGDFHYANVLWENKDISGILDFELAGRGNKEFDIAWAIILRQGQKFLRDSIEIETFLKGYNSINSCNFNYVKYYMILIYVWFYEFSESYHKEVIIKEIERLK